MADTVTVNREDLERTLERLSRGRFSGLTPGEKQAEDRLRVSLENLKAPPVEPAPTPEEPFAPLTLHELLPELAGTLVEMGFSTVQDVQDATDEELLAIDGVGPAKLRKIREAVA